MTKDNEENVWQFARMVLSLNGMRRNEIFGNSVPLYVFDHYSYEEAQAKYKAWVEDREEIRVGEVVKSKTEDGAGVLLGNQTLNFVYILTDKGFIEVWARRNLIKTGKYIDIQGILDQIGGAGDE